MAWKDLTEREVELAKAIDKCGIKVENTHDCLHQVMRAIGARESEAKFVAHRIQLHVKANQLIVETEDLIAKTNRMLADFDNSDKEWERIGKRLGFDFNK